MGEPVQPGDLSPPGDLEDLDFLELHRRIIDAVTPMRSVGHREWGYTEDDVLDRSRLDEFREQARRLIEIRSETARPWGWGDPRATLLLDFWYDVIDDLGIGPARYVLLYRSPWDVSDSMQRLGTEVFLEHPEYGPNIWAYYNRELLSFFRRHRENAVLVCIDALVRQPQLFVSLINSKFGLALRDTPQDDVYTADILSTIDGSDPLISLTATTAPESIDLLAELDREADLSGAGFWKATRYSTSRLRPRRGDPSPDLSVVIPCHDDGRFLVEAIASVERSDFESCELIIVNDGSQDPHTLKILEILREAGHHVIDQENREVSEARNRGIREARGRYILPLDADNRLRPGFAAAAVEILDRLPEVGVVYSDCLEFGMRSGLRNPPEFDLSNLLRGNYIDACAVFRRTAWEDAGGYDPALPAWEDWEFWINVASRGWQFFRLPEVGFEYRVRPGSKVTLSEQPEVHGQIIRHIVAKHADLFQRHIAQGLTLWHRDVRARESAARALREDVESRDRETKILREQAEARLQKVTTLQSQLEARDLQIGSQHQDLEDQKRTIRSLLADVEEKGLLISGQGAKIDDLGCEVGCLHQQMIESKVATESLLRQLGRHQDKIDQMQKTLAWRFSNAWRNLGRRLAPEETLRRRLCDWFARFFEADS
jgi:glycosyltransferase involved in cell wall biosynthesis